MSKTDGVVARTVSQLWKAGVSYVIYNDESPLPDQKYDFSYGHTKGLLATDGTTGFWLTHSVPKYPLGPAHISQYDGMTENGRQNGQSFFCVSVSQEQVNEIAGLLRVNKPHIQDSYAKPNGGENISQLISHKYLYPTDCSSIFINGMTIFAKSAKFGADLYNDCIAPKLGTNLMVESWLRGDTLGPNCLGDYKVVDITGVTLPDQDTMVGGENDHSKYALGDGSWVCFADINRVKTQFMRGGGALCLHDTALHDQMFDYVSQTNSC